MKAVISLLVVLLLPLSAVASEDQIKFNNEQEQTLYLDLTKELRCPKCQNQNIADSNAVVAKDMRVKTLELVQQGKSKQEVIDYMIQRYGQFAHYRPPINYATAMLWVIPIGFIVLAFVLVIKRSGISSKRDPNLTTENLDAELNKLVKNAKQQEQNRND